MKENKQIQPPSTNDSKVIMFGLSVVFLLFAVFGGWMAFAPLAE